MPIQANTGWRRLAPAQGTPVPCELETSKEVLYRAARLAVEALSLRPASRHILDHLIGCYGGEQIKGQLLVWPSNEFLMNRTGLSERAVRYALRELIISGILSAKDSANGKRFAIRSKRGQIIDAYGFDIAPLLERVEDFERVVDELKEQRRQRRSSFDEITICRRQIQETLRFLEAEPCETVMAEMDRITALTPRRDSKAKIDAVLEMWRNLKEHVLTLYNTAYGGNNSRHIEDNNDSPDQSCSNGSRVMQGESPEIKISELRDACPDALQYANDPMNPGELLRAAAELRGGFGVHQSAWSEAVDLLGHGAGFAFFMTLQNYELDQRAKAQIKNFGGYFRSTVRKIAGGQIDLKQEISTLKYRRRN